MTILEPDDTELAKLEQAGFQISEELAAMDTALDDLWTEVKAAAPVPKSSLAKSKARLLEAEQASKAIYTNPENWERKRGIALIHKDSMTCLGNFAEYVHLRVKDCRKLIREEAPLDCEAVEYVEGSWWLHTERKPEPAQVWHEHRQAMLHIYLPELGVHSPGVVVMAFISYGMLARVELTQPTRFAQDRGDQELLIDFPAGTNLIEVMSHQCKIKLKEELGL